MPKISDVTFHKVATEEQKLRAEGKPVSAQAIRKETGGAMKNVLEQYRVLLERKIAATKVIGPISQICIETIEAEIGNHIQRVTEEKDNVISGLMDLADETHQLFREAEQKIDKLEKEMNSNKKEFEQKLNELQSEIAHNAGIIQSLKDQHKEIEGDKRLLNSELINSKIEIGKMQEQVKKAEDASCKAHSRIEFLEQQIEHFRNTTHKTEQRALIAETKLEGLSDKISLESGNQVGKKEDMVINTTLTKIGELEEQIKGLNQSIRMVISQGTDQRIKQQQKGNSSVIQKT